MKAKLIILRKENPNLTPNPASQKSQETPVTEEKTFGGNLTRLEIGLSCCDNPAAVGSLWAAHSKAILTALSSIEGVHGELVDSEGTIVTGVSDNSIFIN